jgi:uncharacterized lipoprotein
MKAAPHLLLGLLAGLPLGGCALVAADCHKPAVYSEAETIPPLVVPAGLDAPDTKSALQIPDLAQPARLRGPNEPCLDAPPRYSAPPPRVPKPIPQA